MTQSKARLVEELPVVLGRGLRRWRDENGPLSQEDVAARLRGAGLNWNRSQVAKLERGERSVTLEQAIQIAHALAVPLAALLAGDGTVRLSPQFDLPLQAVRDVLSGRPPSGGGTLRISATARIATRTTAKTAPSARPTDIDRRAARALGIAAEDLASLAVRTWKRSLADERDRRLQAAVEQGKDLGKVRGHITRKLLDELRLTLEKS